MGYFLRHNEYPPGGVIVVRIVFYHHYSAYEDELANAEYAWMFGKQDAVYLRHAGKAYETVKYEMDAKPQAVNSVQRNDSCIEVICEPFDRLRAHPAHQYPAGA